METPAIDFSGFLNFSLGTITMQKILTALLIVVVGAILVKIILKTTKKILSKTAMDENLQNVFVIIARIVLYTIVVLVVADYFGIPITSLLTVLSIVGLAVSLALQDTLANVFSGMILLASKSFANGDYVQVNGLEGTVVSVDLMNTHLHTFDNKHVRIPNKDVNTSPIINFSRETTRRVDLVVGVSYDNDTETVKKALLKAAQNSEHILADPAPFAGLFSYGESSIDFKLQAWTKTETYWPAYYSLTEGVRETFKDAGVSITFNHIIVHTADKE